jgi:hypothetical protein
MKYRNCFRWNHLLLQVVTQGNSIFTQIGTNGVNLQVNEAGTVGLNITSTLGGIGIKSSTGGSSGQNLLIQELIVV